MDPNFQNWSLIGHIIVCDPFERLFSVDQILPHVSLESHTLENETTRGQEALVVVDGRDD